jgi:hypothetical protein
VASTVGAEVDRNAAAWSVVENVEDVAGSVEAALAAVLVGGVSVEEFPVLGDGRSGHTGESGDLAESAELVRVAVDREGPWLMARGSTFEKSHGNE